LPKLNAFKKYNFSKKAMINIPPAMEKSKTAKPSVKKTPGEFVAIFSSPSKERPSATKVGEITPTKVTGTPSPKADDGSFSKLLEKPK